ncbi:TetR/AcrR family transcriptional regulator [Lonsdalea britannica]|uniref:TetR/AcrR family transcriptional regulator n=1 Tax=Lonsdalea britannica TaxID=1082704 RepID=UPI0026EE2133|nr:TetR/AcrR family transcriptional regulator [Lonsdalea britannica]
MPSETPKHQHFRERQDRIIAAARQCFRRAGFHGAGMAEIARVAELSVGQIYRYFTNKDAIIEEMVYRIAEARIAPLERDLNHTARMPDILVGNAPYDEVYHYSDDNALMLEATAEASRNPRVAEILKAADARIFNQACLMLQKRYPRLSQASIAARVELMAALVQGTSTRSLLASSAPRAELHQLYQHIITLLFSEDEAL